MRYLTLGEVVELHRLVLAATGGAPGIRDLGALESAVAQRRASFGGNDLHPTLIEKAGALGFALCQGHPFVDGNKRVAHAAMATFLLLNGADIAATVDEQEHLMLGLAPVASAELNSSIGFGDTSHARLIKPPNARGEQPRASECEPAVWSTAKLCRAVLEDAIRIESKSVKRLLAEQPSEVRNLVGERVRDRMNGHKPSGFREKTPLLYGVNCRRSPGGGKLAVIDVVNAPLFSWRLTGRPFAASKLERHDSRTIRTTVDCDARGVQLRRLLGRVIVIPDANTAWDETERALRPSNEHMSPFPDVLGDRENVRRRPTFQLIKHG